tara:strand:- start:48 stop:314 length:267 start_codon:yes stop_codon:yes gene_type:complete
MSEKFKAIVIDNQNDKFSRKVDELDKSFLGNEDVLVKVEYSDLNFKDAMILKNGGKLLKSILEYLVLIFLEPLLSQKMQNLKKETKLS